MKVTNSGSSLALSRKVSRNVPEQWAKSELTKFLQLLEEQVIATFAGMPKWFEALERVDKSLTCNVSEMFHEIDSDRRIAALLYIRSLGTFRAATRLAVSGQLFESTVLTRSIIEGAVYAWACGHSKAHREAWANRSKGVAQRKSAKKEFQWKSLNEMLGRVDAGLAAEVEKQYSESIDFGAHPNEQGVSLSVDATATDDGKTSLSTIYMHGPVEIQFGILGLLRAMSLVYRLLFLTIGDRLRILGIDRELDAAARFVLQLIDEHERKAAAS